MALWGARRPTRGHCSLFGANCEIPRSLAPVLNDYCLLLLLSPYANLQSAMAALKTAIAELVVEIS